MSGRLRWPFLVWHVLPFIERHILGRRHVPNGGVWDEGEFHRIGMCGTCGAAMHALHDGRRVFRVFWQTPDGRRTAMTPPCVTRKLKPDPERCHLCERTGDERLKSLCPSCLYYVRGRLMSEPPAEPEEKPPLVARHGFGGMTFG